MKIQLKLIAIFIACLCISSFLPANTRAAKRNAGDVAKLQKIVNIQNKKGSSPLSKDVKTDQCYTWDKNGYLKSITWDACGLYDSINIPSFKKLKSIYIYDTTMLKVLRVADNKSLKSFVCYSNPFGKDEMDEHYGLDMLEIKGCHNLRRLATGGNNKNSFKTDLRNFPKLKRLSLDLNYIKKLDLSNSKQLVSADLSDNNLEEINLSNNQKLVYLDLSYNNLEETSFSNNKKLKELNLNHNKLKTLDVSNLTNLQILKCSDNKISSLDLTHNKKLEKLFCPHNNITELDIRNCKKLIKNITYPYTMLVYDTNITLKKRVQNPASLQ